MKQNYFFKFFSFLFILGAIFFNLNGFAQTGNVYAISLDGGESFYVNDDASNNLDVSNAWTFEAWINVASYTSGNYDCIMDRRTVFSFYLIDDDDDDYAVAFAARNSSGSIIAYIDCDGSGSTSANMQYDTWYHVAATYDGATAKLYVNGTECDSDTDVDWPLTASSNSINIGGRYWGSYSRQMEDADIDEIRVSNIARSLTDMQTSLSREEYLSDGNTVLLMHLNDQNGTPTYVSGTGLNGTRGDDDIESADYIIPSDKLLKPEYRTKATGNWDETSTWEYYNGSTSSWANATIVPNYYADVITILNGHTVSIDDDITINQVIINAGGQLNINSGVTATLNNATGTDLDVSGTLKKSGSLTRETGAEIKIESGGKYQHDTDADLSTATWEDGSTCEVIGLGAETNPLELGNVGQSFYNFTWNVTTQSIDVGLQGLTTINGNFTFQNSNGKDVRLVTSATNKNLAIKGNATITGGVLELTNAAGNCYFICYGNYSQTGGTVSAPGTGTGYLRFGPLSGSGYTGTFTHSGGTFTPENIQINSSYALTLASDMNTGSAPLIVKGTLTVPATNTLTVGADLPNGMTIDGTTTINGTLVVKSNSSLTANATTGKSSLTFGSGSQFTIKSDATSTGSVIIKGSYTNNGTTTVERYIGAYSGDSDGWHLLGSPVATFTINGSDFDPGTNDDLYSWSESQNLWLNHKAGDPTQIVPGTGYLTAWETTDTKEFSGTLNNSDISFSDMSYTTGNDYQGWHLLGNPFPSAIAWDDGNWSRTNVDATAKVWDEGNASYTDISANDIIPSANGFMVHVSNASNSITIPTAARTHSSTAWYKNSDPKILLIAHDLENNTGQRCIIKQNDEATTGYDTHFDCYFLPGFAPRLFSVLGDEKLSTNTLPVLDDDTEVILGFIKNGASQFTIELNTELLIPETEVYLVDTKTGTVQNMVENPVYQFTSFEGDAVNRFRLKFSDPSGVAQLHNDQFTVFAVNGSISVNGTDALNGEINLIDLAGRTLASSRLINGSGQVGVNGLHGIYIVNIITGRGVVNKKIYLQ